MQAPKIRALRVIEIFLPDSTRKLQFLTRHDPTRPDPRVYPLPVQRPVAKGDRNQWSDDPPVTYNGGLDPLVANDFNFI